MPECAYKGCPAEGVVLAVGREPGHDKPGYYCGEHAQEIIEEHSPEYDQICPCCGCLFGVN